MRRTAGVAAVLTAVAVLSGTGAELVAAGTPVRDVAMGVIMKRPNRQTYDDFAAAIGRAPAIWTTQPSWRGSTRLPDEDFLKYLISKGTVPMLMWHPADYQDDTNITWKDIRDGVYDGYITQFANIVKRARGRVLVRLAHEMDGKTFPWALCDKPAAVRRQFVQAWRHVVDIFRDAGATNARFLWSPHGPDPDCPWADIYPGNAFVDFVGVSIYNWGVPNSAYERRERPWARWISMNTLVDAGVDALTKVAPNKPIIIAEVGSSPNAPDGKSKAEWIEKGYPTVYRNYPQIVALNYFNIDLSDPPNRHEDWRLNTPDNAPFREWKALLRDPRFQGTVP